MTIETPKEILEKLITRYNYCNTADMKLEAWSANDIFYVRIETGGLIFKESRHCKEGEEMWVYRNMLDQLVMFALQTGQEKVTT